MASFSSPCALISTSSAIDASSEWTPDPTSDIFEAFEDLLEDLEDRLEDFELLEDFEEALLDLLDLEDFDDLEDLADFDALPESESDFDPDLLEAASDLEP